MPIRLSKEGYNTAMCVLRMTGSLEKKYVEHRTGCS